MLNSCEDAYIRTMSTFETMSIFTLNIATQREEGWSVC
jgi:hypothetical protein